MEASKRIANLLRLVQVSEDILFSFTVPAEIAIKYESLRKKTFEICEVPYIPLQFGKYDNIKNPKQDLVSNSTQTEIEEPKPNPLNIFFASYDEILAKFKTLTELIALKSGVLHDLQVSSQKTHENSGVKSQDPGKFIADKHEKIDAFLHYTAESIKALHSTINTLKDKNDSLQNHNSSLSSQVESQENHIKSLTCHIESTEKHLNMQISQYKTHLQQLEADFLTEKDILIKTLIEEQDKGKSSQNAANNLRLMQENEIEIVIQERDIYKIQAEKFKKEAESIREDLEIIKEEFEKEFYKIKEDSERAIEESNQYNMKTISELKGKYEDEIMRSQEIWSSRENQFFIHLQELNEEIYIKTSQISDQKTNIEDLQQQIFEISLSIGKIIEKCIPQITYNQHPLAHSEILKNIQTFDSIISKLMVENNYLVDEMKKLQNYNESLRGSLKKSTSTEAMSQMSKTSTIFKDFERSRVNLKSYISQASSDLSKTYDRISSKYQNPFNS
ncbi:hypothetical protein SteCoe_7629 [Stentor coeruleus]|uniref:Uncharacterized protein n=1 Tax=Stentor coeruleus TaxID=5963 RepID=A0A1R2CM32_9CILI|nr:hypothetical protein SteCoe_7629 [Stentor coeruleus]